MSKGVSSIIYQASGNLSLEHKHIVEIVAYNYTGLGRELCCLFPDWNRVSTPYFTIFTIPVEVFTTEMLQTLKRQCAQHYIIYWQCGAYSEHNTKLAQEV